ncbi:MAG: inosine triphosphate pyrophosphatase isoform [Candidatus Saccharibacteria bacterium]|nr:inosine triphosphate pyrophosphatase isoform [Candidatus Saccharibacteria bacterium]
MKITLVTGNAHKLEEWRRQLPSDIEIDSVELDLNEIQSIDPLEIMADKAKRAYEALGIPVVVEDVSAGLLKLGGLPGPFVKFFIKTLGGDALFQLAGREDEPAITSCSIAYFDGHELITVRGDVKGTVVAPRGESTFGFDRTFVADGQHLTYGEMSGEEKDKISHRSVAIKLFVDELRERKL